MKGKIGRRGLLTLLAGGAVAGVSVGTGTGTGAVKAEAKQTTLAGLAKSVLGLAEKAQRMAGVDRENSKVWNEVGLVLVKAAGDIMKVTVTGRGVRKEVGNGREL